MARRCSYLCCGPSERTLKIASGTERRWKATTVHLIALGFSAAIEFHHDSTGDDRSANRKPPGLVTEVAEQGEAG